MRINIYAEELYDPEAAPRERRMERVKTVADTGRTFFGARLFLLSANELHDDHGDDDRSAVTIWGPRHKVAAMLRELANVMESED